MSFLSDMPPSSPYLQMMTSNLKIFNYPPVGREKWWYSYSLSWMEKTLILSSKIFKLFKMTRAILNSDNYQRFPIRFDKWYAILSHVLFLPPSHSYVEIDHKQVRVRMGWAFYSEFPRTAISSISLMETNRIILSRGVHGWADRWLVNGSAQGIITIKLRTKQRGYMISFPLQLKQLLVSVEEPMELIDALENHIENA